MAGKEAASSGVSAMTDATFVTTPPSKGKSEAVTKVARWSDDLMADVYGLKYDFGSRSGKLYMGRGCHCDMDGCINLFSRIDPSVQLIFTYSGEKMDTLYKRERGEWKAYEPKRSNQEEKVK